MSQSPILVTGVAGRVGGVGGEVVEIFLGKGLPVRALVRTEDDRAEAIRGYYAAARTSLTDDGRPPLAAPDLKLHDRLARIAASLDEVAGERGSQES